MKENCELSVVLPTYNRLERLQTSLPQYLKFMPDEVELIVIDNASTDGTLGYLEDTIGQRKNTKIISNSMNIGGVRSIYRGTLEASGEYICILCDDDSITDGFFTSLLNGIRENRGVGVIKHTVWATKQDGTRFQYPGNFETGIYMGSAGVAEVLVRSAQIPGLCLRKQNIDYAGWPLNTSIYPQLFLSGKAAAEANFLLIADGQGPIFSSGVDTLEDVWKSRNEDYGVLERIFWIEFFRNQFEGAEAEEIEKKCLANLGSWAGSIYSSSLKAAPHRSTTFLGSLLENYGGRVFWGAFRKRARDGGVSKIDLFSLWAKLGFSPTPSKYLSRYGKEL